MAIPPEQICGQNEWPGDFVSDQITHESGGCKDDGGGAMDMHRMCASFIIITNRRKHWLLQTLMCGLGPHTHSICFERISSLALQTINKIVSRLLLSIT